jgi:hypothetical protein
VRVRSFLSFLLGFGVLFGPAAHAAEEPGNWDFGLAPLYLWAININGDFGLAGRTVQAQIDFGDVWNNLEGVFTTRFYGVYKDKVGFIIDYNYLNLGTQTVSGQVNLSTSLTSHIFDAVVTYRLMSGKNQIDALAGIRYMKIDAETEFNNLGISLDGYVDWVDPVIGARYVYGLSENWSVQFFGDLGGFGAGSDFTWQLAGLFNYHPWRHVALVAGYRALYADYESDGDLEFKYDATIHGPLIGLDIKW